MPAANLIPRPRIGETISGLLQNHPVVALSAPSGYGKTIALAQWAEDQRGSATLLRLDAAGSQAESVRVARESIAKIVAAAGGPVVVVIDDAHRLAPAAGPTFETMLDGMLALAPAGQLRLVLGGRGQLESALSRKLLFGEAAVIAGPTLAMTTAEISAMSARSSIPLGAAEAERIRSATSGWPVAARLALSDATSAHRVLGRYIEVEILGGLEPELRRFITAATTCDRLDGPLAGRLSGRADAAALLAECVARGLFIDQLVDADGLVTFAWQPMFARHVREFAAREDAAAHQRRNSIAARALAAQQPAESVAHALLAEEPALAAETLSTHWVRLVGEARGDLVHDLCLRLPEPWRSSAEFGFIQAAGLDASGDRLGARILYSRAVAAQDSPPADASAPLPPLTLLPLTRALAELFLADSHETLAAAADMVLEQVGSNLDIPPHLQASSLFAVGWTELRLRRDPARAADLLASAMRAGAASGQHGLARRASANLSFALSFNGRFREAQRNLDSVAGSAAEFARLPSHDRGIERFARGYMAHWQHDCAAARENLFAVTAESDGVEYYSALARVYLAFTAAATGSLRDLDQAESMLRAVVGEELHGVPWSAYQTIGLAVIDEARGHVDSAIARLAGLDDVARIPVVHAKAAELHTRAGDHERALHFLRQIPPGPRPGYLLASTLTTGALIRAQRGEDEHAHRLLENALATAHPEGVLQPFSGRRPELRALLIAHTSRGTHFDSLIGQVLALPPELDVPTGSTPQLSRREHEVFGYLRTSMTAAEIAAALFVSINTVKTHQRSIYRKLGVAGRRDAVRLGGGGVGGVGVAPPAPGPSN